MTAVDTATDLSVIEALDFEAQVPCEWPEHGKPVAYRMIPPCGCTYLACEFCKACFYSATNPLVRCSRCKNVTIVILVRFEPIKAI